MNLSLKALVAEAFRAFIKALEASIKLSRAEAGRSPVSKPNNYLHIYSLSYLISNSL